MTRDKSTRPAPSASQGAASIVIDGEPYAPKGIPVSTGTPARIEIDGKPYNPPAITIPAPSASQGAGIIAEHKALYAEWEKGLGLDPPASQGAVEIDGRLLEVVDKLSPSGQDFLARRLAANIGLEIVDEPEHPDSPHAAHPVTDTAKSAAEDDLRKAFMEGRKSVCGINRSYSARAWQESATLADRRAAREASKAEEGQK